uniref:hypothetical protein n=1 Tax=Gelidibacter sp. TaxID=2018083 RepID=UPI00404A5F3D
MKKVLIIFALLISGVNFAENSIELKSEELLNLTSEFETEIVDDQECYAVCRLTVTNSDTGESTVITGIGHSLLSCELATTQCLKNARKKALEYIADQL